MSVRAIAKKLGISVATVSLALRDSVSISAELRRRVRETAAEMGYAPNARLAELMSEIRHSHTEDCHAELAAVWLYPEERPWESRPHLRLVLESATRQARTKGYRLERFWLKQPGMSPEKLRRTLQARGIQGVFCLGSMSVGETFPAALLPFAVVTFGVSVPGWLHRVASHWREDARVVFGELRRRGYSRPGLVILKSGDERTDFIYTDTFLGFQERVFPRPHPPVLRAERWDEGEFAAWLEGNAPDVVVLHEHADYLGGMSECLRRRGVRVPEDLGVALLDLNPDPRLYSGVCQDFGLMGATVIEMLVSRIHAHDAGVSVRHKTELVAGLWNEGRTLRPRVGEV